MSNNASFSLRLLSTVTEALIFLMFHMFFWIFLVQSASMEQLFYNLALYLIVLLVSPVGPLHSLLFTYYLGGTLGKLLTGLRVVNIQGQKLNFKRVFFRQMIGYQFSGLVFGLGFWSILKDENKLAWHDKASGSRVIVSQTLWPLSAVLAVLLLVFNIYLGISLIGKTVNNPLSGQISEMLKSVEKSQIEEATRGGELFQTPSPTPSQIQTPKSYIN